MAQSRVEILDLGWGSGSRGSGSGEVGAGAGKPGSKEPVLVEWRIAAAINDTMSRRQPVPTDVDGGLVVVGRTARGKMVRGQG